MTWCGDKAVKTLLLKTWRDIATRKAQFLALIVLVALGISSYVGFISSSKNLDASLDRANSKTKLADVNVQVVMSPKTESDKLARIDGVKAVQGRQIIDTGLELTKDERAQARVIGVPSDARPSVNDVLVLKGRYLKETDEDACLLQNKFAEDTGKGVGDFLTIRADGAKVHLKIVGIVATPEYFMLRRSKADFTAPKEFAVLFMDQERMEGLFGRGPTYNDYSMLLEDGADRSEVIDAAEKRLEPYRIITTVEQKDQPSNFGMREEIRQNQEYGSLMPIIILIISALTLAISLSRLVQSQRGEIGLSKALGYRDWQILVHYLLFSLIIALAGSLIGFALGQIFAVWETGLYIDILNIPILESRIYPDVIVNAIVLSVVSCVIAGIAPAIRSARMLPAVAMRFDPSVAASKGRISMFERLFGWMLPKTFTVRLPFRDVTRARRRSVYTVLGIAFALILTVATWSMFDSMDSMLDYVFNKSWNYDLMAVFRQDIPADRLRTVEDMDGVSKVQGALIVPAKFTANGAEHEGAITTVEPDASFTDFDVIKGDAPRGVFEGDGVVISETLADKLKTDIGDMISVKTPYIRKTIKLEVRAVTKELWGMSVYTGIKQGTKLKGLDGKAYNALYVDAAASQATDIKKALYELPGAAMVQVKADLKKMITDMLGFMYVFGAIFFGFAFTMAFIVIYNTFTANVIERTREIATMMTIGEDRWHLALMVTLENLLLAVVGIPLGLYLGLRTAQYMYASLSTEAYKLDAIVYPMSYVWITASIIGVLILSEIPPIRRIFKLDLAAATKTMD